MSIPTIINVVALTCAGGLWGVLILRLAYYRRGGYLTALLMAIGASVLAFGLHINMMWIAIPGGAIMAAGLLIERKPRNQVAV
ncbi:MAG: hypothetical protein M3466_14905 [Gemmatimonadota bacterium]|nr:hypothetical protein [Gemmatimonadota bacterium]